MTDKTDSGTLDAMSIAEMYDAARRETERLQRENADLREQLAALMMRHGITTGHGDTIADLLGELDWQLTEREQRAEAERRRVAEECEKACMSAQTDHPSAANFMAIKCARLVRALADSQQSEKEPK